MIGFRESIVIRASPEEAFAYLANPDTASVIDPAVITYRPERLPMGVGVRNHIKVRFYGLPMSMVSETIVWEEGRRMVLDSVKPSRPVKGRATHLFEPHPDGTRYTWEMEFIPSGALGAVVARVFARFMRANAKEQQARFKAALESGSSP